MNTDSGEYELELKVKNGVLKKLMIERGIDSCASLSRSTGIAYATIVQMLNLKVSCYKKNGEPRFAVLKLARFFNVTPEMIYPEDQLYEELGNNKFTAFVSKEQMLELAGSTDKHHLIEEMHKSESDLFGLIDDILPERTASVLRMRIEEGMTLEEVGGEVGVTKERVRQIEAKAIRMLRHPSLVKKVAAVATGEYGDYLREVHETND